MRIAYVTDVEGRWDKLSEFVRDNPLVSFVDGKLQVAAGALFVFGGDAIDRGVHGRRLVRALIDVKRRQPDQVVLLAGNRDINKVRLPRELSGAPPKKTPDDVRIAPKPQLLKWIFANTMGAAKAFEMRQKELAEVGAAASDEAVVESYLEDLAAKGEHTEYLSLCQLAFRHGPTLFVHGAVTEQSLGHVPGTPKIDDVNGWADALNAWYREQIEAYRTGRVDGNGEPGWSGVVMYQAPTPGTKSNQASVVYGRLTDENGNPHLPIDDVVTRLMGQGVRRIVLGHTPSGDSPSILAHPAGFEMIMADNSYGRVETGSRLILDDERVEVASVAQLDDGTRVDVRFERALGAAGPVGMRVESGHLVKGMDGARVMLFRGLPGFKVEQTGAPRDEISGKKLVVATETSRGAG